MISASDGQFKTTMMLASRFAPITRYFPLESMSLIRLWVLLFPIGVIYVEHWASTFFGLLILTSLILWPIKRSSAPPLYREEKVLLWILGAYFIVAVLSITANGWDDAGVKALGNELKFLLIIPFYLLIRRYDDLWRYLWIGSLIGLMVTVGSGLYEYFVLNTSRTGGAYGPLFVGPVLLLMVALQLPWFRYIARYHWRNGIVIFIALLGLFVILTSGARSAYLALLASILVSLVYYFRARNSVLFTIVAIVIIAVGYFQMDVVKHRVDRAVSDVDDYFSYLHEHPDTRNKYGDGSVGARLELWRASALAASEQPVFGVGRYNFIDKVKEYAREGRIHNAAARHRHSHSAYFEALASKGILGLAALLTLYFYPLYFFVGTRRESRESAFAGVLLILIISIASLTDPSPVYRNTFTALFLSYLTILFAWHTRRIHKTNNEENAARPDADANR